MSVTVRRTVVALSSVASFTLVVWVVRVIPWSWLPDDGGERLALGTGVGAVVATLVPFVLSSWTPPDTPAAHSQPQRITQIADAADNAVIEQSGGAGTPSPTTPAASLVQRARGRGRSRIRQTR
ncbi:hypothetical protein HLK59_23515 [Streptomyces sp. S3(2020)]|uniref:hypothetical protein n=1 Tax=Streptomyces sp. S3(2020) TaxID=2732044 RepID=UPI0014882FF1|nr:hypothetical protein [Streptomyces sp. S3(2020)]NNN33273.1 hypothetical protein [Streptomyces sp. S3(2020)]